CFFTFAAMNEKKTEIAARILPLFRQYGIKALTMDDIASNLGISKKTLYIHFSNKNDLVKTVLDYRTTQIKNMFIEQVPASENAIDEFIRVSSIVYNYLKRINPAMEFELKKYYQPARKKLKDFHQTKIKNTISKNLKRGIKEGLYRR